MNLSGTWLAHPRLQTAIATLAESATARNVLESGSKLKTNLVFEAPPSDARELISRMLDDTIASYEPIGNRMMLGATFGISEGIDIADSAGGPIRMGASDPLDDAGTLVHETVHRNQNKGFRAIPRAFLDSYSAPIAGVRQIFDPVPPESRGAAFMRGFDVQMMRREFEAFRVEDLVLFELGKPTRFHGQDGVYLGDAVVQATVGASYAATDRKLAAGAWATTGLIGGGVALGLATD